VFYFEIVWAAKNIQYDVVKIAQLATTFRGHALVWYMKLHIITPMRQVKILAEIKKALLKEFKKPKSELEYIIELK
jgi:hypothetical protein